MAKVCELTGKGVFTGNLVSHSNRKTRTRWLPNLKNKRFTIPELGQVISIRLSTSAIRTIDKKRGISNAIRDAKPTDLSPRLQAVRAALLKKSQVKAKPAAEKTAAKSAE